MAINLSKPQSIIIAVVILTLFFTISILASSWRNGSSGISRVEPNHSRDTVSTSPAPDGSTLTMGEFHRSEVKDGRTVWEVNGIKGSYSPSTNTAAIEKAVVLLYGKSRDIIEMRSVNAKMSLTGTSIQSVRGYDGVIVKYGDSLTVETQEATFDQTSNMVEVPTHVKISTDSMEITGDKMTLNATTKDVTVVGGVKTVIQPRNDYKR